MGGGRKIIKLKLSKKDLEKIIHELIENRIRYSRIFSKRDVWSNMENPKNIPKWHSVKRDI